MEIQWITEDKPLPYINDNKLLSNIYTNVHSFTWISTSLFFLGKTHHKIIYLQIGIKYWHHSSTSQSD